MPPAVAGMGVMSIRPWPAKIHRMAVAVRSTGEAGAAAVSNQRDSGARFASRRERHRLTGRRRREADERKERRNQGCSHEASPLDFGVRQTLSEGSLNGG